ncbi:MAG: OmpA family protein, partial [Betaproteobacteria bacterium]|nr:OmpA family protein [Betaproteobacteria bacterium]
ALLATLLLAACASTPEPTRPIAQSGNLKVHPGLLGQPVPPELQTADASAVARVAADGADVKVQSGTGMKVDLAGLQTQRSIYFDYDKADIRAEFEPVLQAHGNHLKSHPAARVRVEGNADERGGSDHNKRLGLKRADAVRQSLVAGGAQEQQVRVVSYGESRPKLKGHDEESWAENRRADIVYEKEE